LGLRPISPITTTSVERGIGHVENRQVEVLEHAEVVFVHVVGMPVGAKNLSVHANKRDARFDQAAGGQQRRSAEVATITVADRVRLFRQIEGLAGSVGREHRKRLLAILAHRLDRRRTVPAAELFVELIQQRVPRIEPIDGHLGQGIERGH
jgi:hypothetical protein